MATSSASPETRSRRWRRPPGIQGAALRWGLRGAAVAYLVVAVLSLHIDWSRLAEGAVRGWRFVHGFLPPDFVSKTSPIAAGLIESLGMTVVATAAGVAISIPIGFGAARNLTSLPVYLVCRAIVAVSRTFQELIVAIVFVAMVGFGPLAGILTLTFGTIGFFAKLQAEAIEASNPGPLTAVRATGARWPTVWLWAVYPQIRPRLLGLTLYRLDINFRESAIIGIVGAGGIGAVLQTSLDRYEYDTAAAILLIIIAIVVMMEYGSSLMRKRLL